MRAAWQKEVQFGEQQRRRLPTAADVADAEVAELTGQVQNVTVDDLDRCPPQHVVEMLEAVHLLLAVDLFVALGRVRKVPPAPRRLAPHLAALSGRPSTSSTRATLRLAMHGTRRRGARPPDGRRY
ncbi:P-loop NTPase fold protein, partial [Streptomyces nojiriensis]|uniref:P-loop NTPase fold protein n=1 Tax=Streptomyces nojiriensis TaxID=66374 RepID=UPI0035D5C3FB